ncbi:signal peptidase I [Streptomyces sp. NPDC004082]
MPGRIHIGNAENFPDTRGWFMGDFLAPHHTALITPDIEMKWGNHPAGQQRHELSAAADTTSVAILISGHFEIHFPGRAPHVATLQKQGDFVLYEPGVAHTWQAVDDSVILTVRWHPRVPAGTA